MQSSGATSGSFVCDDRDPGNTKLLVVRPTGE